MIVQVAEQKLLRVCKAPILQSPFRSSWFLVLLFTRHNSSATRDRPLQELLFDTTAIMSLARSTRSAQVWETANSMVPIRDSPALFHSRYFAQLSGQAASRPRRPFSPEVSLAVSPKYTFLQANGRSLAYATTVESDIFKPTKYGGKYTVTLIPGTTSFPGSFDGYMISEAHTILQQVMVLVPKSQRQSRRFSRPTMSPLSGSRSTFLVSIPVTSTRKSSSGSRSLP